MIVAILMSSDHFVLGKELVSPPWCYVASSPALQANGPVTTRTIITYTYDLLSCLTDVTYSNG